jgi:hypothetical protein
VIAVTFASRMEFGSFGSTVPIHSSTPFASQPRTTPKELFTPPPCAVQESPVHTDLLPVTEAELLNSTSANPVYTPPPLTKQEEAGHLTTFPAAEDEPDIVTAPYPEDTPPPLTEQEIPAHLPTFAVAEDESVKVMVAKLA